MLIRKLKGGTGGGGWWQELAEGTADRCAAPLDGSSHLLCHPATLLCSKREAAERMEALKASDMVGAANEWGARVEGCPCMAAIVGGGASCLRNPYLSAHFLSTPDSFSLP